MYDTAAFAAWLYSGNVTGPDSRFSRPTVIGAPVALLSVPSAAAASGVAALGALVLCLVAVDDGSSPPQPASRPTAARHAAQVLVVLMTFSSVGSGGRHGGFTQVAGAQQVTPAAQVRGRALEHEPSVAEYVR